MIAAEMMLALAWVVAPVMGFAAILSYAGAALLVVALWLDLSTWLLARLGWQEWRVRGKLALLVVLCFAGKALSGAMLAAHHAEAALE